MKNIKIYGISKKAYKIIIRSLLVFIVIFFILALATRIRVYENRDYDTKEEVALYIYKYKKIPRNFVTKDYVNSVLNMAPKEAISRGYNIGGDNFESRGAITNYTSLKYLHECDIYKNRDVASVDGRGTNRLVYNQYGNPKVYYTDDHYQTFQYLSKFRLNIVSNIMWIVSSICVFSEIFFVVVMPVEYKLNYFSNDKKKENEIEAEEIE